MLRTWHLRFTSLFVGMVVLCGSAAAQNWIEIRSKNFTVTTDAGDKRGREVALRFEQMREVFGSLMLRDKINPTAPLAIIAFKNHKEIAQVSPLWKGKPVELAGVYYGGDDRHFIALDLSSEAGWSVVFHEYAHMLLNTNYPPAQVWFDEGFAEYFSTIEISKKEVKVGLPPEYIAQELSRGMMPIEQLFSVTQKSQDYNEGARRSVFYAESWLVVHYMYDMKRIKELPQYFNLVLNQKKPVAEAIKTAWGLTPEQMDQELYSYLNSRKGVYYILHLPNVGEDVTYAKRDLKDYEAEGIIADLHLHSTDYFEASRGEFESILQKNPQDADANRGLGYWYMHKNDLDKAEEYFQKAAKLGSTDARVHYLVAQALYRKGDHDAQTMYEMMQSLEAAIKYDHSFAEAYNLQGYVYSSMREYPNAIEAIRTAIRLNPRNEHFQMNLGQQYMAAEKYDDAIFVFNKLKGSADPAIAENATRLVATAQEYKDKPLLRLEAREQPKDDSQEVATSADSEELKAMEARQRGDEPAKPDTRPMKYVTGKLVAVDCSKQPAAVLRVSQGEKTYKLMAPSVSKMLVIGANEFSCLWKDRKVSVNYRESAPLQGDIVSVEVY